MQASGKNIKGLMTGNNMFRIPFFQRRYVWEEENWERFADDMESLIDRTNPYFLGSLIFKKEPIDNDDRINGVANKYFVVDGQQRLTTLFIYMKILHMATGKQSSFNENYMVDSDLLIPTLDHNSLDRKSFDKIMKLEASMKELEGDDKIIQAYRYFRNRITSNEALNKSQLLKNINALVNFVTIVVDEADDEQQIFDTINSLGVDLNTDELMKNFLYCSDQDEENYSQNWKPVFDTKEEAEFWKSDASANKKADKKENKKIEQFFHAFVRIKMWDFPNLTSVDKKNFVKLHNTFNTCKSFVKVYDMSRQDLANEIIEYAKIYKNHFNREVLNEPTPKYACVKRLICFILSTKSFAITPYILYILRNVTDIEEQNKIFGYLETYLIRRVVADSANNNYSDLFSENLINNKILTFERLKGYIENKPNTDALAMPQDDVVKRGICYRNKVINEQNAQAILYLYESKLASLTSSFNDFKAIQMMSKKPPVNKGWITYPSNSDEEDVRIQRTNTLGNFFLIDDTGEKGVKKLKSPQERINAILKYENINTNNHLTRVRGNWTSENIDERNKYLADAINTRIWSIN